MSSSTIIVVAVIVLVDIVVFAGLSFLAGRSRRNPPRNVGTGSVGEGTGKPNCVSSVDKNPERAIEPFIFQTDPESVWEAAVEAVGALDRTEIIRNTGTYLHAEVSSSFFKFVDDLELQMIPGENVIHVCSASRIGYSDMGANRSRVEELRNQFQNRLAR